MNERKILFKLVNKEGETNNLLFIRKKFVSNFGFALTTLEK